MFLFGKQRKLLAKQLWNLDTPGTADRSHEQSDGTFAMFRDRLKTRNRLVGQYLRNMDRAALRPREPMESDSRIHLTVWQAQLKERYAKEKGPNVKSGMQRRALHAVGFMASLMQWAINYLVQRSSWLRLQVTSSYLLEQRSRDERKLLCMRNACAGVSFCISPTTRPRYFPTIEKSRDQCTCRPSLPVPARDTSPSPLGHGPIHFPCPKNVPDANANTHKAHKAIAHHLSSSPSLLRVDTCLIRSHCAGTSFPFTVGDGAIAILNISPVLRNG
ncbi:hypothetical protein GQ44DRAFT_727537 [Phaeosphaeriaceae sp. PMI808]|nr:hypothetical protein GQ44DRAFT_727537 [Phaeosphaeriaceae sp. PMI808]